MPALVGLWCVAALLALAVAAIGAARTAVGLVPRLWREPDRVAAGACRGVMTLIGGAPAEPMVLPIGLPGIGRALSGRCARRVLSRRRQPRRRGGEPLRLGYGRHESAPLRVLPFFPGLSRRHEPRRAGGRRVQLPDRLGVHVAVVLGAGDGEPPRARECARRLHLSGDGELRHARAAARLRPARGRGRRLRLRRDARAPSGRRPPA